MEVKDRILNVAQELFYAFGLKSITMDDVARKLGMSKKTLYLRFSDKDHLINTLLNSKMEADCRAIEEIENKSKDAVQEVILIMKHVSEIFSAINPNLFYDMQKYHPGAWKSFLDFKDQTLMKTIESNLKKGITQGLYRKNLETKIVAKLRMEQVTLALNPGIFPPDKFNLTKVQLVILEHFLFGIVTLKGHKLINKYLQINEDE